MPEWTESYSAAAHTRYSPEAFACHTSEAGGYLARDKDLLPIQDQWEERWLCLAPRWVGALMDRRAGSWRDPRRQIRVGLLLRASRRGTL
jgi:hypothetical protein